MSWMPAACGPIDSPSATSRNDWPGNVIRGPTCPVTPVHWAVLRSGWRSVVPELPDVEGFRRELAGVLPGRRIQHVQVHDPGILRNITAATLGRRCTGHRFGAPRRHGKWLILPTDGPTLLVHSGMTGHPYYAANGAEPKGYERLVVSLDKGELRYADLRKLRGVWLAADEDDVGDVMGPPGADAVGSDLRAVRERV